MIYVNLYCLTLFHACVHIMTWQYTQWHWCCALQCITVAPLKAATPLKRPPLEIGLYVTVCSPTSVNLTSLCKSATPLISSRYLSHLGGRIKVLYCIVLVFVFLFCPPRYQCSCSSDSRTFLNECLEQRLRFDVSIHLKQSLIDSYSIEPI